MCVCVCVCVRARARRNAVIISSINIFRRNYFLKRRHTYTSHRVVIILPSAAPPLFLLLLLFYRFFIVFSFSLLGSFSSQTVENTPTTHGLASGICYLMQVVGLFNEESCHVDASRVNWFWHPFAHGWNGNHILCADCMLFQRGEHRLQRPIFSACQAQCSSGPYMQPVQAALIKCLWLHVERDARTQRASGSNQSHAWRF